MSGKSKGCSCCGRDYFTISFLYRQVNCVAVHRIVTFSRPSSRHFSGAGPAILTKEAVLMSHSPSAFPRPAKLAIRVGLVLLAIAAVFLLDSEIARPGRGPCRKGPPFPLNTRSLPQRQSLCCLQDPGSHERPDGTLSGQSSGSDLYLALYAAGQEEPFTDIYVQDSTVLLNVRRSTAPSCPV